MVSLASVLLSGLLTGWVLLNDVESVRERVTKGQQKTDARIERIEGTLDRGVEARLRRIEELDKGVVSIMEIVFFLQLQLLLAGIRK